jgi:tetratricopeptide (TPR) repeat protein
MSRHDWYRNTTWNAEVAAAFELKLKRARSKEQYVRIQACTLKHTHPEIALWLLERFFQMPDQFDAAQAWVDRADAYLALGNIEDALNAYEGALTRETEYPRVLTQAYIELPYLIATRSISSKYARAHELLEKHKARLMFPVDRFKWNASNAILSRSECKPEASYQFARAALEEASSTHSGFQYHPSVGLVQDSTKETIEFLQKMCSS